VFKIANNSRQYNSFRELPFRFRRKVTLSKETMELIDSGGATTFETTNDFITKTVSKKNREKPNK